jgi:SAM-dependent methyltransferase
MGRERLRIEFGRYADWLVEAIDSLRPSDPIPAASRGTGNPLLFDMMAEALNIVPGMSVLDVGSGLGGPSAWLARERDCNITCVDVMEPSVAGARRLFPELVAVVASSRALPFQPACFDAAWALGVLETIADKEGALREVARVLKPATLFGVYTYTSPSPEDIDQPRADRLETERAISDKIRLTGLEIVRAELLTQLPRPPAEWMKSVAEVRSEVEARHGNHDGFSLVMDEVAKAQRLFSSGVLEPWVFIVRKPK